MSVVVYVVLVIYVVWWWYGFVCLCGGGGVVFVCLPPSPVGKITFGNMRVASGTLFPSLV